MSNSIKLKITSQKYADITPHGFIEITEFNNNTIYHIYKLGRNKYRYRNIEEIKYETYINKLLNVLTSISAENIILVSHSDYCPDIPYYHDNHLKIPRSWLIGYIDNNIYKTLCVIIDENANSVANNNINSIIENNLIDIINKHTNEIVRARDCSDFMKCDYYTYIINETLLNVYINDVIHMFKAPLVLSSHIIMLLNSENDSLHGRKLNEYIPYVPNNYTFIANYFIFIIVYAFYTENSSRNFNDAFNIALNAVIEHYKLTKLNKLIVRRDEDEIRIYI